jgi:dCMP deaminase
MTSQQRWDQYFIDIANVVRTKSKDPSTTIGAVIVGQEKQTVSTGFNGFPRGLDETDPSRWERPIKYQYVEHAERNAIYNAARTGVSLVGCTLYLVGMGPPSVPCTECARGIIQAGIVRVCGKGYKPPSDAWLDDFAFSRALLAEAGVVYEEMP